NELLTKEQQSKINNITKWFLENKQLKGNVSLNSLLLKTLSWQDNNFLHDISKLCLSNQLELTATCFSNYVPFYLPFEEEIINNQMAESSRILKKIYPNREVKSFYPPFGCFDRRLLPLLEEQGINNIIVDWRIIAGTLNRTTPNSFSIEYLRPYKIKDHEIYALPSVDLHSIFHIFLEAYEQYLKTGEISKFVQSINSHIEESKIKFDKYYTVITFNFNQIGFPEDVLTFDFDNFFNEIQKSDSLQLTFLKPSEVIKEIDNITEIDLKDYYSFQINPKGIEKQELTSNLTCQCLVELFKEQVELINICKEELEKIENENLKTTASSIIRNAWIQILKSQHNLGIANCGGSITKRLDFAFLIHEWLKVKYTTRLVKIIRYLLQKEKKKEVFFCNLAEGLDEVVFLSEDFYTTFSHKGGILNNLISLKDGKFFVTKPSNQEELLPTTQEPKYGLFYDIISKRYSGQFHLSREWYAMQLRENTNKILFSYYLDKNILLSKKYTIYPGRIKVTYDFENRGIDQSEEFVIYNVAKFDLGAVLEPYIRKDDFKIAFRNRTLVLENKKNKAKLKVRIDPTLQYKIKNNFQNIILTTNRIIPQLAKNKKESYEFELLIEER
ncbi:MAG: hypothetical protein ACTSPI_13340, partial [Candidatus Heimdallarchaeaceae archaeon]